jgi:hypothetical protein
MRPMTSRKILSALTGSGESAAMKRSVCASGFGIALYCSGVRGLHIALKTASTSGM